MRRKIDLVLLILVIIIGFFAIQNAIAIGDWWHRRTYTPSDEIQSLAEAAGLNETGQQLFFRFEPAVIPQEELDQKCTSNKLGCAEGQSIFILSYSNPKEYNQAIVTGAHEMLHVAYSRLSPDEQTEILTLLNAELGKPDSKPILSKLEGYPEIDYYNEAHSFIGTELENISTELENYYERYFSDRGKVMEAYNSSVR